MEARPLRAALLAVALLASFGASYRTDNFVVNTADPRLAQEFATAAEKYRKELAIAWLGQELPKWASPCPITIQVGENLGAGGETSFVFDRGEVFGWRMSIQGSVQRLGDSVLPHEITHMIFASHFRQPLPRWADEGGASSVEHPDEKAKHQRMLQKFLRTGRGIAFNQMFAMTEYPRDVMPLYAQGYTVVEYLIQQGGRRKFVNYLDEGLRTNNWSATTSQYYGIDNLGQLQQVWLAWVAQGYPPLAPAVAGQNPAPTAVAAAAPEKRPRPEPNLIYHTAGPMASNNSGVVQTSAVAAVAPEPVVAATNKPTSGGWHQPGARAVAVPMVPIQPNAAPSPVRTQVTHPQPVQGPQQTVIDWGGR
jgi:hypothetical protein